MDAQTTCCFTGHRPEKLPWGEREDHPNCVALKESMAAQLARMYEKGYRHFLCGMARGADFYFAEGVLALREAHPDVTLEAALPCAGQAKKWSLEDRARWTDLVRRCDSHTLLQEHYDRQCMLRRDRYMVDRSSAILAVFNGTRGGTQYTLNYAMDHRLDIYLFDLNHPQNAPTHLVPGEFEKDT